MFHIFAPVAAIAIILNDAVQLHVLIHSPRRVTKSLQSDQRQYIIDELVASRRRSAVKRLVRKAYNGVFIDGQLSA